jgi:hypothetical protein
LGFKTGEVLTTLQNEVGQKFRILSQRGGFLARSFESLHSTLQARDSLMEKGVTVGA